MRQTSALYKELFAQTGSYYDVNVVRGDVTYGLSQLISIDISDALFEESGPKIGGVCSSKCNLTLREESTSWPRMASFEVILYLCSADGTQRSEALSMGKFYTDERHIVDNDVINIVAYDSMLLLEQTWTDKVANLPAVWPVTAQAAGSMLTEATGVLFDSRTTLDNTTPFIGLNTKSTAREVLATIAAGLGGNWRMTAEGKLNLVPLCNFVPGTSALAGVAIAGVAINGTSAMGGNSDICGYAAVGRSVMSMENSGGLPGVTNVQLETDSGTVVSKVLGDGYTLKANCNFADGDIVNLCADNLFGYLYRPFAADGAILDPAAETGDFVEINGDRYQLIAATWHISKHVTADISAPYDEEVDHEYVIPSPSAKTYRKAVEYADGVLEQARSYIQQTETSITQGVAESYVNKETLNQRLMSYSPTSEIEDNYYTKTEVDGSNAALASEIQLTSSSLTLAFSQLQAETTGAVNAMTYYIRYENGVIIIGRTDRETSVRISDEKISLFYGTDEVSYWDQNKQYTPGQLQIPVGGKFTLGNILFQPRSSGNMSIMLSDNVTAPNVATSGGSVPNVVITAHDGDTVTLTADATGDGLSYQWEERASVNDNWVNCSYDSAESDTLTFTASSDNSGYSFRCAVTNDGGTVYTNVRTLFLLTTE